MSMDKSYSLEDAWVFEEDELTKQPEVTTALRTPTTSTEDVIAQIPLPNQLPRSIDFTTLPQVALKSATLETLIGQNEDLMARLAVSLRKCNQLEEHSEQLSRENTSFRAKFDAIREKYLVLEAKDKVTTERGREALEENATLKGKTELLEKYYADLYVQAQAFQRRMVRLERYRARVRKATPDIQARAKRLSSTTLSSEAKIAELQAELESLQTKAAERDQVFAEKVRIENQGIHDQRQHQLYRDSVETQIERLGHENASMRKELKTSLVVHEADKKELERLRLEIPSLEEKQSQLRDQVESLQTLWAQKQRELDAIENKVAGLQKLNQTLSITLNQRRKEIQDLQGELERERYSSQEKIKTLIAEVQLLRKEALSS